MATFLTCSPTCPPGLCLSRRTASDSFLGVYQRSASRLRYLLPLPRWTHQRTCPSAVHLFACATPITDAFSSRRCLRAASVSPRCLLAVLRASAGVGAPAMVTWRIPAHCFLCCCRPARRPARSPAPAQRAAQCFLVLLPPPLAAPVQIPEAGRRAGRPEGALTFSEWRPWLSAARRCPDLPPEWC